MTPSERRSRYQGYGADCATGRGDFPVFEKHAPKSRLDTHHIAKRDGLTPSTQKHEPMKISRIAGQHK